MGVIYRGKILAFHAGGIMVGTICLYVFGIHQKSKLQMLL
jgi:hypothetical protein